MKAIGGTDNEVLINLVTHVAQLTKQLSRQQGTVNAIQTNPWELCEFCGGQHSNIECQSGNQIVEHAQYVSRFNQSQPQQQGQYGGNNYHNQNQGQGWRNTQNSQNSQGYGWRNNKNNMPPSRVSEPPPEKKVDLEQDLAQMLTSHTAFMNETRENMQNQATQLNNQAAQLRNLEVQMGQMENLLTEGQHGSLPSNSEVNPRGEGKEYCKAITLRSRRELESSGSHRAVRELEIKEQDQIIPKDQMQGEHPRDMRVINDNEFRKEIEK